MVIDHICFAVKDIEQSIIYWDNVFGYRRMTETVINSIQQVKVAFLRKEGSIVIKLIEPLPGNKSLTNFVSRNGGFHHVCFRCENINSKISELTSKGLRLLAPPQPGEAFNNKNIAFLFDSSGINIELIETDEKASLIEEEG